MTKLWLFWVASAVAGCASASRPEKGWRSVNIHRVAVVCVQNGADENRQIEADAVPVLRRQGFAAAASRDLFPVATRHSPRDLLKHLQRERIDGILEVKKVAGSRQMRFRYHAVKGLSPDADTRFDSLDAALAALLR